MYSTWVVLTNLKKKKEERNNKKLKKKYVYTSRLHPCCRVDSNGIKDQ